MSVEALAQIINIIKNTVYRWQIGICTPSNTEKREIAEALNMTVSYLIAETGNPAPTTTEKFKPVFFDEWIKLPVLSEHSVACMGNRWDQGFIDTEVIREETLPAKRVGEIRGRQHGGCEYTRCLGNRSES